MLREMYEGKIVPWERHSRCSSEQLEIVRKITAEEKYFEGKLSPDDYERFKALSGMYSEISNLNEYDIYSYGFSIGMLLMADVMNIAKIVMPDEKDSGKAAE